MGAPEKNENLDSVGIYAANNTRMSIHSRSGEVRNLGDAEFTDGGSNQIGCGHPSGPEDDGDVVMGDTRESLDGVCRLPCLLIERVCLRINRAIEGVHRSNLPDR